ncbi:hypothetical protein COHA_005866 [Chlorella ohadii]|uniref:ABC transporter domain-containing protein n=1 Tax=Chlorella ohadii TaxID=2649997 RepID=A0AAD5H4Z7_9CHLO|nr:hypothetical protein COHA_005866 [Chlorella ohadii]
MSSGSGDVEAQQAGLELAWSELSVFAKRGRKRLLDSVSGQVGPGFTAIMGPSGAGKSTLLNALACRLDKGATLEGKVRLNGQPYTLATLKRLASYVMQDDLLNAHHTVEETLVFSAKVGMHCFAKVVALLLCMGAQHTLVGSPLRKGISGGERKRLCVAVELLTQPQLLFLDEPSSGLDSVTALSLCQLLRELADSRGCTILTTIHQPSSKIFELFHGLILLQTGRIVYQGPPTAAIAFFARHGFPCPPLTNPADHVMDVIATPPTSARGGSMAAGVRCYSTESFVLQEPPVIEFSENASTSDLALELRQQIPWARQYRVLLERCVKEQQRKWRTSLVQLVQSMLIAALIGGVFFQIGTTQTSVAKRLPVLFFCTINQGVFGALAVINSFPGERALVLRERASGMYYASAYYLAKSTAEAFIYVVAPVSFSCIAYWMVGLQPLASKFFIFVAFMVLCQQAAVSLAQAVSALCRDVDTSVVVLPMCLEVMRLFGGFFLAPALQQKWMVVLDYLSYVRYSYFGIALNELTGLVLTCTPQQLAEANGRCPVTSGEQTIDRLDLNQLSIASNAGILVAYIFLCRLIAFLGIRFLKH